MKVLPCSGVLVRPALFQWQFLEIGKKRAEFALGGAIVQALKKVRHVLDPGTLRKAYAFAFAHHPHDSALPFVGEKIIKPHPEYHGDAQESGQSRKQLSSLQLR